MKIRLDTLFRTHVDAQKGVGILSIPPDHVEIPIPEWLNAYPDTLSAVLRALWVVSAMHTGRKIAPGVRAAFDARPIYPPTDGDDLWEAISIALDRQCRFLEEPRP